MALLRSVQSWLGRSGIYVSRKPPYHLGFELRQLFDMLEINCVIDVGAHWGEYGSFVRRVLNYEGRIVSFEPSSANFEKLLSTAAGDDNWLVYNCALGDAAGLAEMHTFESTVFNSLLQPTGYAEMRFGTGGHETGVEAVTVRMLDECIEEITQGISDPRIFLKTDTQGYDHRVLAGAENAMDRIVALQSEIAMRHLYRDVPDFEDAVHRLRDLGFVPIGFFPVEKDADQLSVIEFDCVAIRAATAVAA
jgi:FkbM family methyltransferase